MSYILSSIMSSTTVLNRSPPGEPFITGMSLGSAVDAVTGELIAGAIDESSIKKVINDSNTHETYHLRIFGSHRELGNSAEFRQSSSITFPVEGLDASVSSGINFSSSETSIGSSLIIILSWERTGVTTSVGKDVSLSASAKELLSQNPDQFRITYGDYFISEIAQTAKFVAVW